VSGSATVDFPIRRNDLVRRNKPVVAFFGYSDKAIAFEAKLEDGNAGIAHELGGNGPAHQIGKLFGATGDVLLGLNGGELVIATLRLHRDKGTMAESFW